MKTTKYIKNIFGGLTAAMIAATALVGCIKDDIPYPHIQANFTEFVVADQTQAARIDTTDLTVTVYLPETSDIEAVNIESYKVSGDAQVKGDLLDKPLNLRQPQKVNLYLYYDYEWTIEAVQPIERYFTITGQVGASVIDVDNHTVTATVTDKADLTQLTVETVKLGAIGSVMSPELTAGSVIDLSQPLTVDITDHGRTEKWTVSAEVTTLTVETVRVDAWTNVAWVYGQGEAGAEFGVEYRLKGDQEWTRVPADWLTVDGGSFHARLIHLSANTAYEARAVNATEQAMPVQFTTGSVRQCPNSDFEAWWLDGKVWCPWVEGGDPYWGTGNKGATTLGQSNTVPTTDTPSGTGQAAMLQTKFVGISFLGKLAAGNIFVGSYVRTVGTNGVLSFGREFNERPVKLRGYLKYKTAPISSTTKGFEGIKGQPDTCIVWCSLIDSAEPFEIRTDPNDRKLFNQDGPEVVAYGSIEYGQDVEQWIPFEIPLDYKATDRVPRYILITASASKYGDFFTGGDGATLWVDDLELVYDY